MTTLQMTEKQIKAKVAKATKRRLAMARLAAMLEGAATVVEYVQTEWADVPDDCGIPQGKSDEIDQFFDDVAASLAALQKALEGV